MNPDYKGTLLFDVEYLRNGASYWYNAFYNAIYRWCHS